MSLQSIV